MLEKMEGAAGNLASAMKSVGILAVRLRQIYRRVPELAELVERVDRELAGMVDDLDCAHEQVSSVLADMQGERSAK